MYTSRFNDNKQYYEMMLFINLWRHGRQQINTGETAPG